MLYSSHRSDTGSVAALTLPSGGVASRLAQAIAGILCLLGCSSSRPIPPSSGTQDVTPARLDDSVGRIDARAATAAADTGADARAHRHGKARFRVIGYEESWTGDDLTRIQFDKLTHVNYAFALPNPNGTMRPVPNEPKLDALVTRAHQSGVTVSLSFGGWNHGDDSAFHAMVATPATRRTFADAAFAYVQAHRLDGADIDWEYPETEVATAYTELLAMLSERLKPAGKLLTVAVSARPRDAGGITLAAHPYIDYFMLMAYDNQGEPNHSSYAFAMYSLDEWSTTKSVPPSKLVLGVPFYSNPNYRPYSSFVATDPGAAALDSFDGEHFNGIPTIVAKTKLALERASGIMIWELSQDTSDESSLLRHIDETVRSSSQK